MTDTTTQPGQASIAAFAAQVRAELDDLPADEVDELLDGLEADLADQAADAGDGFVLPEAAAYAAELRAAAGLEPRAPRGRQGVSGRARRVRARLRTEWARAMREPVFAQVVAFLVSLRPVWWLLRAWVVFALLQGVVDATYEIAGVPENLGGWLVFSALTIVSVQWGRGRWAPHRWLRVLRRVVTVITAAITPSVLLAFGSWLNQLESAYWNSGAPYDAATPGLAVDGERVRNIFAYDLDGNPLDGVQLFDQNGSPLATVGQAGGGEVADPYFNCGGGPIPVPWAVPGRAALWNVYPLREVPAEYFCAESADSSTDATAPQRPFDTVAPVPQAAPAPTTGPSASPTAEASGGPDASPRASASASPAPSAGAGG